MRCSKVAHLFDDLGKGAQRHRQLKIECFGRAAVDHELKFSRLNHRQVGGFISLENPTGVNAHMMLCIGKAGPIAHQPTRFNEAAQPAAVGSA
jgi:hypothetical protein